MKIKEENKAKILKIFTIVSYIVSILIYEICISNGNRILQLINGQELAYNFSLCRLVLYIAFMILLVKYIDKFIDNALKTLKYKSKKIGIPIYIIVAILIFLYVAIKWGSIYKSATVVLFGILGIIFLLYVSADYVKNMIVFCFTFGIVFTFSTEIHHSLDEKKHIMTALNMSQGNFDYEKNPLYDPAYQNIIFNCDINDFAKFYSEKYKSELSDNWDKSEENQIYYVCSKPAEYNFVLYIPSTIGILYARLLGGSVADVYIMGRVFNLIAYMVMAVIALKLLPYKKKIFYIILTFPIMIVLAASYSIDGMCMGLITMFIAYCLKLENMDYKEIGIKNIVILIMLLIGCLLAKNFAYIALGLLIFILPIVKILKNNKKRLPIILSIIVISIVICSLLLLKLVGGTTGSDVGDPRGGDTSVPKQIEFLCSSPTNIIKVGFAHITNSILNYNWYTYMNDSVFFGKYNSQIFFLQMIFILYVAFTDNSKKINKKTTIISVLSSLCVFAMTSLMLYLTFTPVGQINISGYQPRYVLPILPLLLMLINSNRFIGKSNEIDEEKTDVFVSIISIVLIAIDFICLIYIV